MALVAWSLHIIIYTNYEIFVWERLSFIFIQAYRNKHMPEWKRHLTFPGFHLPLICVHFVFCKQPDISSTCTKPLTRLFKIYQYYCNASVFQFFIKQIKWECDLWCRRETASAYHPQNVVLEYLAKTNCSYIESKEWTVTLC